MDLIQSLLGLENSRIKFLTGEGYYEGTLSRIAPKIQLLVFSKLIWLPKNIKLGTLTFRATEILSFTVTDIVELPKIAGSPCNRTQLYGRDCHQPMIFDDEFDNSVDDSELNSMIGVEEKEYMFEVPPFLSDVLPLDNVIIDKFNENFYSAIQHFWKQDVIGLSVESPKMGRFYYIHWLCISTASCTFLFDIKTLGESVFSKGIQEILENARIEKVVHDSREISDCLFHIYNTKLANIFDTQVADYIINQQRRKPGKILHYVHPLNSCLSHYLNIPEKYLFYTKKCSYQDNSIFYGLRPLIKNLRDCFTNNVIYLRQLKQELDSLIIEPLNKCVNVYIRSLRCKTDRELQLEAFKTNAVPDELLFEGIQVFRFKNHVDIPAVVYSGPPYRQF